MLPLLFCTKIDVEEEMGYPDSSAVMSGYVAG